MTDLAAPSAPAHTPPGPPPTLEFSDRLERAWPIRLFFNAVFQKEMRVAGRKSGTYLIRAIYAGLMLALVSIFLIQFWHTSLRISGAAAIQELQSIAPTLAIAVVWFAFCMLALIAPVMTVPAFMEERRRRALPALMTTPLSSAQIVCAKLLSSTIQLIILALLGLPVLLAVRVFGGVSAAFLLRSTAVLLSAAILIGAIGLRFSLYRRRADAAIVGAILTAALIQAGPVLAIVLSSMGSPRGMPRMAYLLPVTCSPITLVTLCVDIMGGVAAPWTSSWVWLANTLYNCAWALVFIISAIISLRRILRLEGAGIDYLKAPRPKRRRAATALAPAAPVAAPSAAAAPPTTSIIPAAPPTRPTTHSHPIERDSREVSDRPVLWRELRQPTFRHHVHAIIATCVLGAFLILIYSLAGFREEGVHFPITVVATLAILIQAAASGTAAFTSERDARTWETLLTTPLSPREIVWSKFIGILRRQWYVPALLGIHLLLSVAVGALHPVVFLHLAILIPAFVIFLTASGVFFSLIIRRATSAAVVNLALGLFLWLAGPMLGALITELFDIHGPLRDAGEYTILAANPLFQVVSAVKGAMLFLQSSLRYDHALGTMNVFLYTGHIAIVAVIYTGLAALLLFITTRLFTIASGRSS